MWSACVTRTSGAIVAIVDRHTLKNMPRSCLVSSIQSIRKRIIRRTCYNYISAVNYFSTIFVSGLEGVNPLRSHSHHPTVLRTPPTASFPPPPCHHAQSLRPATSPVTTLCHHALPPLTYHHALPPRACRNFPEPICGGMHNVAGQCASCPEETWLRIESTCAWYVNTTIRVY